MTAVAARARYEPASLTPVAVEGALNALDEDVAAVRAVCRTQGRRASIALAERARSEFERRLRKVLSDPAALARMTAAERRIDELTLSDVGGLPLDVQKRVDEARALVHVLTGVLSMRDIAARAGCSTTTVHRWCAGDRVHAKNARKITQALREVWEGL
jgi:hypothetical protein